MSDELEFAFALLLSGASIGLMYSLIALGFVLVYKATDAINFAQGEFVMLAGMVVVVVLGAEAPLIAAIVAVLLVMIGFGFGLEKVVLRPLLGRPVVAVIVATIVPRMSATPLLVGFWHCEAMAIMPPWYWPAMFSVPKGWRAMSFLTVTPSTSYSSVPVTGELKDRVMLPTGAIPIGGVANVGAPNQGPVVRTSWPEKRVRPEGCGLTGTSVAEYQRAVLSAPYTNSVAKMMLLRWATLMPQPLSAAFHQMSVKSME